ncbi:MAG: DUF4296 domain-containing protein [Salinimicrobium sp.]
MRFSGSILLLFFVLISCQNVEHAPKPDDLIAEDEMVDVLVDISLLHGARSYNKKLLKDKGIQPYNYLWEKYKIDSTRFLESNNYYADHPKQYENIYQQVKLKLETLQVKYDSIREIEKKKQDSIKAAKRDSLGFRNRPDRRTLNDSLKKQKSNLKVMPPAMSREDTIR